MTDPSRHDLLGYLAGALDADERLEIEQALRHDLVLREKLRHARRQFDLVRNADFASGDIGSGDVTGTDADLSPPPGLADRTLQFIAEQRESLPDAVPVSGDSPHRADLEPVGKRRWRAAAAREPLAARASSWRFIDFAVALSVCVALGGLVFPMLSVSRANARIAACANNLREVGVALTQYSEHQNGFFPRVAETGSLAAGGIYAPTLLAGGYVANPQFFVCPASSVAEGPSLRIPTLAELNAATGIELTQLRRQMGGTYGYALGYRQAGVYRPTRNLFRDSFALVADMPSEDFATSPNHRGNGQNVLLEDGHVVFLKSCRLEGSNDDIFTNDDGKAAAGCHVNDAVVVRSDVSP